MRDRRGPVRPRGPAAGSRSGSPIASAMPSERSPASFAQLLSSEDPSSDPAVARLFPPALPDDVLGNLEFEHEHGDELLRARLEAIDTVERTLDRRHLDEDRARRLAGIAQRDPAGRRNPARRDRDLERAGLRGRRAVGRAVRAVRLHDVARGMGDRSARPRAARPASRTTGAVETSATRAGRACEATRGGRGRERTGPHRPRVGDRPAARGSRLACPRCSTADP